MQDRITSKFHGLFTNLSLKKLELKYSPKCSRKVSDYDENMSAALQLPLDQTELDENLHNIDQLIELSKPSILEHATRRVDLFFYTLIAYYKTDIVPELGWTKLQFGKGRHSYDGSIITEACHSSFTPSLIDNTLLRQIPVISDNDENLTYKNSLVCSTHLMDNLASTVELPSCVNRFDTELEVTYHCRRKSLAIIAKVAKGLLTPTEGLSQFFMMMENTFKEMLKSKRFYHALDHSPLTEEATQSKLNLLEIIKNGTFANKWNSDTQQLNEQYIFMLLRLNLNDIKACKNDKDKTKEIIDKKYTEIQNEILSTPSKHVFTPR